MRVTLCFGNVGIEAALSLPLFLTANLHKYEAMASHLFFFIF